MLRIGRLRRPDMEAETPEVHRPQHVSEIGGHERTRRRAVGCADDRGLQPVWSRIRYALLEERRATRPIGKALEQHRPPAHRAQQWLFDSLVVPHQVELGVTPFCKEDFARARDRHLAPGRLDQHRVLGHDSRR